MKNWQLTVAQRRKSEKILHPRGKKPEEGFGASKENDHIH